MVFSSPIFLFGFLPTALLIYYLTPKLSKNIVLLLTSLLFYAWGEVFYVGVMLVSILSNYIIGRLIFSAQNRIASRVKPRFYLTVGVVINVWLLISFKYANFITDIINEVLSIYSISTIDLNPIHLPLGISFFTFQAISYIVDIYRKEVKSQNNIYNLALDISLFTQIIAGPIVRYRDVAEQITERRHSIALFTSGLQRFIIGLSKKILIANALGKVADNIFVLPVNDLTMPLAWIGILAYALQIYFDFAGYSDMAIGLGRMFGFRFYENFNYPYIATSLREFWKRWHISLSKWFRDYIYIPLGGNRVSVKRVYLNLITVFFLTGVWHGASLNFIVWGMFHGFFLTCEHFGFSKILEKLWKPFQHLYLLLVIIISWVFFRVNTLTGATSYLFAMVNIENWNTSKFQYAQVITYEFVYVFVFGMIFSIPLFPWLKLKLIAVSQNRFIGIVFLIILPRIIILTLLLLFSFMRVASSTYNPFIYFRF